MRRSAALAAFVPLLCFAVQTALLSPAAYTQAQPRPDPHAHQPPPASAAEPSVEREYFSDVVLINQDGESMRFYSDLLQGNTVVINSFFTSCTGVCPVMAGKLVQVQDWLGDRLGKDVVLISLSVDPETDTRERLKAYAERFGAKPGWYFLGGTKENVDWALYRIGEYVEDKEAHSNIMIVGNEPAKVWRKAFGLAPAPELIALIEATLEDSNKNE